MGFSIVWVEFEWDIDVYDARQTVSEKLLEVSADLPDGVGNPTIAPQSSLLGEVMIFAMTAKETTPMNLRTYAEWSVRPRLLSVGGVAQVHSIGGDVMEYQILADPHKMKYYNVSLADLIAAGSGLNENSPGGFLNEHGNEYIIRGIARTKDIEEMGNNVIKVVNGYPVKIQDVANLKKGAAPKIGDGSYRGEKAVILTVTKQPGINTLKLHDKIIESLEEIKNTLPDDVEFHTDIFTQASFIETAVSNVKTALIEGSVLVIVILFVFLMNYRTTLISLLAIPISLLVAILTLKWLGITINTMTLGGMAIAIGSLVDDAIIDVENVFKRLKENHRKPIEERENSLTVIFNASKEIRASILNATLIIIVAFIPLFFLSGMEGKMLKPLGIAYIVSLFASLLVAITITPVLCSVLLTGKNLEESSKSNKGLAAFLAGKYKIALTRVMDNKKTVMIITTVVSLAAVGLIFTFGRSFLPPFNEGSLTINVSTMPGVSLEESDKLGLLAEKELLAIPEINSLSRRTGRAELAEHSFGGNVSELDAPYAIKDRSRSDFLHEVREKLNEVPGVVVEVGQPITHRMDHMLSGSKANIALKLFGTDLSTMYTLATDIKNKIAGVEGIGDLNVEQQVDIPQIYIKPRRELLAKYGITIKQFNEFVDYAFAGEKVSDVFEGERRFDLVLRYDDEHRENIEALKNAMIDCSEGKKVPLFYVADIFVASGPNTISRENVKRKIVISVNVADRDVGSVVSDIKNIVDSDIKFPENYYLEYSGQFESEQRASRILMFASLGAILIIFMLLYQEFKSGKTAGIILLNLPLALIGGVAAIYFTNAVISIPAIIGFITLFGIATRNGILLVSRYNHMIEEGYSLYDSIIHGSADRLNPILMTALTAALALVPLAIGGDLPGNEIQSPMAVVILGGLLTSTLLNVFIIPIVYYIMNKKEFGNV
jgi:CzcA family heavy metal efflux pump